MNVVIVPPAVNSDRLQSQPEPVACCSWTDRQASTPGPQLLADTDSDLSGGTAGFGEGQRCQLVLGECGGDLMVTFADLGHHSGLGLDISPLLFHGYSS